MWRRYLMAIIYNALPSVDTFLFLRFVRSKIDIDLLRWFAVDVDQDAKYHLLDLGFKWYLSLIGISIISFHEKRYSAELDYLPGICHCSVGF